MRRSSRSGTTGKDPRQSEGVVRPTTAGGLSPLKDESGQSVVEFGLVVPLLCALVLVLVDFGKFMNYWLDLTHIANYGARLAAVNTDLTKAPYSSSLSLDQFIQRQAETSELQGATVSICFPAGTHNAGDPVKIQVAYDYDFVPFIGRTITVKGSATMRLEHEADNFSAVGSCS